MEKIFIPTINALNAEDSKFKGCLYFGLMITKDGPKVIEYNCRFGDPETQVVLPLLKTDLLSIMLATENECLDSIDVEFYDKSACCVVIHLAATPKSTKRALKSKSMKILAGEYQYFPGGYKLRNGKLVTSSGRVLGVTAVADTLKQAIIDAYKACSLISFTNCFYRKDRPKGS